MGVGKQVKPKDPWHKKHCKPMAGFKCFLKIVVGCLLGQVINILPVACFNLPSGVFW